MFDRIVDAALPNNSLHLHKKFATFPGMFGDILLRAFPRMVGDIAWNVW